MYLIFMYLIEKILDFIFPEVCGVCEDICKEGLCTKCRLELQKYKVEQNININNKYFDELLYLYRYEGLIRNMIIKCKFNEKPYIYRIFAREIINSIKLYENIKNCDIIIPVPIHKKRELERGYNQTDIICKIISNSLEKKLYSNILIKIQNNEPQSKLNRVQRKKNVLGVYKVNDKYLKKILKKTILLVDDVYTTGATVNECSKILKQSGVKKVIVLVIAKD